MPEWDIRRRSSRASTANRDRARFHAGVPVRRLGPPNNFETKLRVDIRKLLVERRTHRAQDNATREPRLGRPPRVRTRLSSVTVCASLESAEGGPGRWREGAIIALQSPQLTSQEDRLRSPCSAHRVSSDDRALEPRGSVLEPATPPR